MEIICSICQCSIGVDPPNGSTELADLYDKVQRLGQADDQEQWISGRKIVTTPCGHLFHNSCLTQWFVMIGSRRCPLCNLVSPVHKILCIYPCVHHGCPSPEPFTDLNGGQYDVQEASMPSSGTPEGDLRTSESSATIEEETSGPTNCEYDLEATETIMNGIRTKVYHFGVQRTRTNDMTTDILRAVEPTRPYGNTKLSMLPCPRCNNLSRIQALMTNDMKDLRDVISEQNSQIESFKSQIEILELALKNVSVEKEAKPLEE